MIDIKIIREKPEWYKENLKKRGSEFQLDKLISKDKEWRNSLQELEKLRHEKNVLTQEIAKQRDEEKIKRVRELNQAISKLEGETKEVEQEVKNLLMNSPNVIHDSVPIGKTEKDNVEIRKWGEPVKKNFKLKSHGEVIEELGIGNFEKAAQVTGEGFNYLFGDLALLDMALQRFAIDYLTKKRFKLVYPPFMLRKRAYEGAIELNAFEEQMYKIKDEDKFLIATSEHPLIALYSNEVIPEEELPIKLVGVSTAFRKEAGAHGVDTKGLFRMHQFNKVEQVVICKPEDSYKYLEEIHKNIEELYKQLKIPFRTIEICSGDLSIKNSKQYDIEAWFPRQNKYAEVGSSSNCTEFQSRGLNIKYGKIGGEKEYAHTLNATGMATSRAMVAILENYQNEDGSVAIPKALIPYMNGKELITKQ